MKDDFYPMGTLLRDRAFVATIIAGAIGATAITTSVVFWEKASRIHVMQIADVSVSNLHANEQVKSAVTVEDVKKIFSDNTKVPPGTKFVVYTAKLLDVCNNNNNDRTESALKSGNQLVIANIGQNSILGTMSDNPRNCEIASKASAGSNVLVTSSEPFNGIPYDRQVVAVRER
jgi:hypothetical protein